jgi:hypothetical protein
VHENQLLLSLIVAMSLVLSSAGLGQTTEMTGKVLAVTSSVITVQKGTEVWDIKRGRNTSTTVTGDLKVGSTVTIKYNAPDAQKKEGPAVPTPSDPTQ